MQRSLARGLSLGLFPPTSNTPLYPPPPPPPKKKKCRKGECRHYGPQNVRVAARASEASAWPVEPGPHSQSKLPVSRNSCTGATQRTRHIQQDTVRPHTHTHSLSLSTSSAPCFFFTAADAALRSVLREQVPESVKCCTSLDHALAACRQNDDIDKVLVIGGAESIRVRLWAVHWTQVHRAHMQAAAL